MSECSKELEHSYSAALELSTGAAEAIRSDAGRASSAGARGPAARATVVARDEPLL
jgi:hypothetical protein